MFSFLKEYLSSTYDVDCIRDMRRKGLAIFRRVKSCPFILLLFRSNLYFFGLLFSTLVS